MKRTLKIRDISLHICSLLAVLFIFSFVGCAPTDENFDGLKDLTQKGDSIVTFEKMRFDHGTLKIADASASANHTLNGYVIIKEKDKQTGVVTDNVLATKPIFDAQPKTSMNWAKTSGEGAVYLGQTTGKAQRISDRDDQVKLTLYQVTTKLKFIGKERDWVVSYEVPTYKEVETHHCVFDSAAVVKQVHDTIKTEVIERNDQKVYRVISTSTVRNYFSDKFEVKTPHSEDILIKDTTYVAADIKPGEKVYQGSVIIEGTQKYYKLSNGNYHSEMKITSYYTQDGKSSSEEELIQGEAIVRFSLEANDVFEVPSIAIGNPKMVPTFVDAEKATPKGEELEAIVRTYSFPFKWDNNFNKNGKGTVERLYFVRGECRLAMPTAESSMSFANYLHGNPTLVGSYNFYNEGRMYFNGIHNITDKTPLEKSQVFKVKVEDEKTGFTVDYKIDENNVSWVIFTETWSVSGTKTIKYGLNLVNGMKVSNKQRVYGESLDFVSGLAKSSNNPKFDPKEEIFARMVTTVHTAKYNLCDVQATTTHTEGYVMYDSKRYDFKTRIGDVSLKGTNTPTAQVIEENLVKISRKSYEVTFTSSINGDKIAYVDVDKVLPNDPTLPDPWGKIDWDKTKQWGGSSWFWQLGANNKPAPTVGHSIITTKGVILVTEGGFTFTQMDVTKIAARVSGVLNTMGGNKWTPARIDNIQQGNNFFWRYVGFDGKSDVEINGGDVLMVPNVDRNKPFFETPSDSPASTYKFSNGRLVITYNGAVVFDETSSK